MANEVWAEIYDRLAELVREHRTTLIFVNTRRLAERAARHLAERLGEDAVTAHHGSLAREHRLDAEERLKAGKLQVLVATASLELGIDIGDVDLVCQIASPKSIATLLQRVGRSGHGVDRLPKGRLFPVSRDDLVECAALLDAVRREELDAIQLQGAVAGRAGPADRGGGRPWASGAPTTSSPWRAAPGPTGSSPGRPSTRSCTRWPTATTPPAGAAPPIFTTTR